MTTRLFPRPPSVTSCRCEFLDRLIGRLVQHLKQVGMYDDTLIVITADHGVSFRAGRPAAGSHARPTMPTSFPFRC